MLAATSILSDLMEVCPPAETCRDAFERMSRATVRMGSGGFATQTIGGGSLTSSSQQFPLSSHATKHGPASRGEGRQAHTSSAQRPQRAARPRPQFDMNLSDFYQSPPNIQDHSPNRQQQQQQQQPYPQTQKQTAATQPNPSRDTFHASPQFAHTYPNYDQSPPQQQQQQQFYFDQSPQSVASVAGAAQGFTPPAPSEQQSLNDLSLDFLDSVAMNQGSDATSADQNTFNPMGMPPSFNPDGQGGNGASMGFGMEADYMRDLTTDGSGYDLMDGYWFGMSGGGSGI